MNACRKIKRSIKTLDLFASQQMLRYQNQNEYQTYTGGIISIILLVTVITGFANMIIETLNLSSISSTLTIEKLSDPSSLNLEISSNSKFMFGLEIAGTNLSQGMRYFDVITYLVTAHGLSYEMNPIPMGPCTKEHWKFLPEMVEKFDVLGASNWLCPDLGQVLEIAGKYSSSTYKFIYSTVNKCNSSLDLSRPCANDTEISNFLFNEGFATGNGYYTVFFSNPIINPSQEEYINYFLEDKNYMIFNTDAGGEAVIYLSDYTIESDKSIWPYENNEQDSGFIVYEKGDSYSFNPKGDLLLSISFAKSTSSLTYDREVQKISSVFSFIGGLIGAFSTALFVIKLYTDTSFEVSIGLNLFSQGSSSDTNTPQQEQQVQNNRKSYQGFNFLSFLKLKLYELLKKFRFKSLDDMKFIHQCHQQVVKQLDIKSLIKRIIFIESSLTYMLQDYQIQAMQIPKILTPQKVRQLRKKFNIHNEQKNSDNSSEAPDQKKEEEEGVETLNIFRTSKNNFKHKQIMNEPLKDEIDPQNQCSLNEMKIFDLKIIRQNSQQSKSGEKQQQQKIDLQPKSQNQTQKLFTRKGLHKKTFQRLQFSVQNGDMISKKIYGQIEKEFKKDKVQQRRTSLCKNIADVKEVLQVIKK